MPIYEYQCRKCEKVFEALIRSDKDVTALCCPHCQGKKVNKLFSTFATNSDRFAGLTTSQRSSFSMPVSSSKSGCSSCSSGSCTTCK
ncbi:MAG: zinc ribbon domain-containing protein [Planctomycetota bacterium]